MSGKINFEEVNEGFAQKILTKTLLGSFIGFFEMIMELAITNENFPR